MYADDLKFIQSHSSWDAKIDALSMLLKTYLYELSTDGAVDHSFLEQVIAIAIEGTSRRLEQSSTLGDGLLLRANFADVIDTIVAIMFCVVSSPPSRVPLNLAVVLDAQSSPEWRLLERLGELLRIGSQWTLRLATGRKFTQLYVALPPHERAEWERCRTVFAEHMVRSQFDPLFSRLLVNRGGVLRQALDRMRYFGTLAQLDRRGDQIPVEPLSLTISNLVGLVFHTTVIRSVESTIYGFLVLTSNKAVLWTSSAWSAWVNDYLRSDEKTRLNLLQAMPTGALARLIDELELSAICVNDLSRGDIPLELAVDPEAKLLACVTPVSTEYETAIPCSPQIQFCGGFEYGRDSTFHVDEAERTLHWSLGREKKASLQYPQFPTAPIKVFGVPKPLLFSHYERWELTAIAEAAGATLKSLWGRTSRQEFLDQDWTTCDILHMVSHGEAFPEFTEGSHLVLGNAQGLPECVTLADILALDWSNTSLVFLNCCVTAIGTQTHGDDRLSLAWAFLAGGTKFVIGHRWRVHDEAAYMFAKHFYRTLLQGNSSIRVAFRHARHYLRQTPTGNDVSIWGTFVLLENPWVRNEL